MYFSLPKQLFTVFTKGTCTKHMNIDRYGKGNLKSIDSKWDTASLSRIAMIDNPTCDCGTDRQTPEHNIFHCQNNAVHRDILSFVASQTPIPDRVIISRQY